MTKPQSRFFKPKLSSFPIQHHVWRTRAQTPLGFDKPHAALQWHRHRHRNVLDAYKLLRNFRSSAALASVTQHAMVKPRPVSPLRVRRAVRDRRIIKSLLSLDTRARKLVRLHGLLPLTRRQGLVRLLGLRPTRRLAVFLSDNTDCTVAQQRFVEVGNGAIDVFR